MRLTTMLISNSADSTARDEGTGGAEDYQRETILIATDKTGPGGRRGT